MLRLVDLAAESLIVAALLGELVLVLANVVARARFHHSFLWADEIARLALSILAFIGGAVAYRRRDHAFVRVILSRLPSRAERGCLALADVVVLSVAGITGIVSIEFLIFAGRIEQRTDGAIKIAIFPNNQLGGPPEQAQQIKLGTIDMGLPTQGQLDKYDKAFAAVMLPFIFNGPADAFPILDGPTMDWLAPLAEKQGFVLLRNWEYGFRNVTNNVRPINLPDDVTGLKIRTPPELQIQASMEALGAVVQAIAFPELYLALSQGVVDGEENPIPVIYFNKIYEVQKHLALTRHIYNNMIHTIGVNSWKRLTPDQQAIFREGTKNSGELMRKLIADPETEQVDKLQKAGMRITRPDLAPFRAKMDPAYKRIADYAGEDNVRKFREIVDKYRKA